MSILIFFEVEPYIAHELALQIDSSILYSHLAPFVRFLKGF